MRCAGEATKQRIGMFTVVVLLCWVAVCLLPVSVICVTVLYPEFALCLHHLVAVSLSLLVFLSNLFAFCFVCDLLASCFKFGLL